MGTGRVCRLNHRGRRRVEWPYDQAVGGFAEPDYAIGKTHVWKSPRKLVEGAEAALDASLTANLNIVSRKSAVPVVDTGQPFLQADGIRE
jgi:hypothetical protein